MKIFGSNVCVDEDGVGGGVVDLSSGRYQGFMANTTAMENPVTAVRENYANLKTQCHYHYADRVNGAQTAVWLDNVIVDGERSDEVRVKGRLVQV